MLSTVVVKQEHGYLLWQSNLTHFSRQQTYWQWHPHFRFRFLHKKICCRSIKNAWKTFSQPDQLIKFVLMQDSWKQLKSDNFSWQNILTSSYNLQSQWHVTSLLYHEMTNKLTRKVGFKGTPKLDPYWKSQPVTYKVNTEWKSELILWTTTKSHSLVRTSHDLNKLVTDLIDKEYDDNEQETSTTNTEVLTTCIFKDYAYSYWFWTRSSIRSSVPVAKRINTLLRHGELVRYGFIKIRMKVVNFIKNHFHQKPFSSKSTFDQAYHFHQKTPNPKDLTPKPLNP